MRTLPVAGLERKGAKVPDGADDIFQPVIPPRPRPSASLLGVPPERLGCGLAMNAISPQELFVYYLDTAQRGSSKTLSLGDDWIEYNLFEECATGFVSYFHDESLSRLSDAKIISQEAVDLSRVIRKTWLELESTWPELCSMKSLRQGLQSHPRWMQFFSLCDQLLELLDAKPSP